MAKRIVTAALAVLSTAAVSSCSSSSDSDAAKVCLNEYVTMPILQDGLAGLQGALAEEGYAEEDVTFDIRNPEGDAATQQTIVSQFISDDSCTVLVGFTTPGAQAFLQPTRETPLVFFAAGSPTKADLAESIDEPGNNTTGVSDPLPVEEELAAMLEIDPGIRTVGLVWKNGDASGDDLAARARVAAEEAGIELIESPIAGPVETTQAAQSLVGRVDAIQIAGDGPTISGVAGILKVAAEADLPVFGGTTESVDQGALLAGAYDYGELGEEAGRLVARILDGDDAGSIPVYVPDESTMAVNRATLESLRLRVPEKLDVAFTGEGS